MDDLPGKVIDGRNNEESKTLDVDKKGRSIVLGKLSSSILLELLARGCG
jgi:hypothetical protein